MPLLLAVLAFWSGDRVWVVEAGVERPLPIADASWPAYSPDGKRIAFTSVRRGGIFVAGADGTGLRRVTTSPSLDVQPSWSPDGRRLAFARSNEIYIVGVNGKGLRRLTRNRVQDLEPAWAPNGKRIAFTRGGTWIWTVSPDGRHPRRLVRGSGPSWSPDSRFFALSRGGDLFVAGRNVTRTRGIVETRPSWSPDGSTVAFLSTEGDPRRRNHVWSVPAAGGERTRVSSRLASGRPTWR